MHAARQVVQQVQTQGDVALRRFAEKFGDLDPGQALVLDRKELATAASRLPKEDLALLKRTASRIERFALAQKSAIQNMRIGLPGGEGGHEVVPMEVAGCYAPGGRFPLPSSVLMTAVTAKTAGVPIVWVASPKPTVATLAAAHVAGADALLAVGGAQAIAAFAYGTESVSKCDAIVGPGNRFVTAAKQLVAGHVAIDMLAGPSELVVLADDTANPAHIAADLLGQAEHDPDARVFLVTPSEQLAAQVDQALSKQLETLDTAAVAKASLAHSLCVLVANTDEGIEACNQIAPEHLQLMVRNEASVAKRLKHYGGLFRGRVGAEVYGDYGAGPNHVLPTAGTARITGGLSVFNFLRIRTWLNLHDPSAAQDLTQDVVRLARIEGLEAHARAAEQRLASHGSRSNPSR